MHRWIEVSRRAGRRAAQALHDHPLSDLGRRLERGEGGDVTMVVDQLAEASIFAELEELGTGLTAISEERGRVEIAGGGPPFVVIDPVDGSLNAKRGLPSHGVSIAVASGERMSDVDMGFVLDLASGEEWWALRDGGAFRGGTRLPQLQSRESLEIVGLETARPELIAEHSEWIAALPVSRVRALGSVALSMCLVAAGSLDA